MCCCCCRSSSGVGSGVGRRCMLVASSGKAGAERGREGLHRCPAEVVGRRWVVFCSARMQDGSEGTHCGWRWWCRWSAPPAPPPPPAWKTSTPVHQTRGWCLAPLCGGLPYPHKPTPPSLLALSQPAHITPFGSLSPRFRFAPGDKRPLGTGRRGRLGGGARPERTATPAVLNGHGGAVRRGRSVASFAECVGKAHRRNSQGRRAGRP